MKMWIANRRHRAITTVEVLVVVVCVVMFAAMLLPALVPAARHSGPNCLSNIKQINLAFKIWAEDNNNQYPMTVSVNDGGAMELIETGNLVSCFQVVSNELSTTQILVCPADHVRTFATNWNALNDSHISYFFGANVSNASDPAMVLDGDDNLQVNGSTLKPGLFDVASNSWVTWTPERHGGIYRPYFWSFARTNRCGNIGLADGSVRQESQSGLQQAFQGTGLATNRIAIP